MAALLGGALLLAVCIGALVSVALFFSAADPPSPFVGDGFLCCSYPDTWTEVGLGTAATMVAVAGTVALFLAACWLFALTLVIRRPGRRLVGRLTAAAMAVVPVLVAIVIVPRLDEARVAPDCDGFVVDRRTAAASSGRARQEALLGVKECGLLIGKTVREARDLIGPSTWTVRDDGDRRSGFTEFGQLHATFERGRIVSVAIDVPDSGFD